MSQPTPDGRLAERLRGLPPDAIRLLEGALERAQAKARVCGVVEVEVTFEVRATGLWSVTVPTTVGHRPEKQEGGH